ncbi:hypothetical protein OGAPHI_000343 [Ogataea philodendri]|uniref:Hsp90 chaperone protein kinase-targeting subunit n=2 Tax=Saccharomycotina TaxID=147537 RepID=A0A9P8PG34_9ASCO|nr:uncharacterized protein OGAPHI_000343 [Ogataea philodendri]KAH3671638.1 hypothetical protein OGAPHI_000343 [Ogataea philodendri]
MPIDYSKWDKIELSDDSDVEVHPNVDKKSFIKWKQRDIHEKRIQRDNQIKGLKIQKEMYTRLNARVDKMISTLGNALANESKRNEFLNANFDPKEKCALEDNPDSIPYNEMVEDLFVQISDDLKKENKDSSDPKLVLAKVLEHRAKIETVLKQIDPKLEELNKEKHLHISSDDIHDGWNSSFINKKETPSSASSAATTAPKSASTSAATTIETINTPAASKLLQTPSKPLDELDELELLPETEQFAQIPSTDLLKSIKYLEDHLYIVCEQQKDALMMKTFDHQLDGDSNTAKQVVHQALILQYLDDLFKAAGGPRATIQQKQQAVGMFVGKLLDKSSPASRAFEADWDKTYKHIVGRCEIIKQEHDDGAGQEGVEQIQLRSMDPNSELVINLPAKDAPEYEYFEQIPETMQKALETKSLDKINDVFATMSVSEAEGVLELFDKCGVIQIQALLENEDEFNHLKEEYEELGEDEEDQAPEPEATATADIVD